jgi:hypothetical protein
VGKHLSLDFVPPTDPKAPVPLDYGHVDPARDAMDRSAATTRAWLDRVGGWRQIVFAVGLTLAMVALGHSVSNGDDEICVCMTVSGLMIGFAVPIGRRH